MSRAALGALLASVLLAPAPCGAQPSCESTAGMVAGTVSGPLGPLAGARVRVQGCLGEPVLTDAAGAFMLPMPAGSHVVAASAPGHYIGCWNAGAPATCAPVAAGAQNLAITLDPLPDDDDPAYVFRDPEECAQCHQEIHDQWSRSTMARTNHNRWVDNLYNGTDLTMPRGPAPDPNAPPYFGFLQRHNVDAANPSRRGECANCHQPEHVGLEPTNTSFNDHQEPDGHGVGCDFCHKIVDVDVSEEGIRRPNLVVGEHGLPAKTTMLRSTSEPWLAFGPLDDASFPGAPAMRAAHATVVGDSRLCASCHEDHTDFTDANGDFLEEYAGPPSQTTYSEWKASKWAADGVHCADCHMPPTGDTQFCSRTTNLRDPSQVRSHEFPGTTPEFLHAAVALRADTRVEGDVLRVAVEVENVGAGHDVPTGVTQRNLILVVDATDRDGERLEVLAGPTVPNWGGVGDPAAGNFAGMPGKGYARVLVDEFLAENVLFTEAVEVFDNRIAAGAVDRTEYAFQLPPKYRKRDVRTDVTLYYRRAFKPAADQRKWNVPLGDNPHGTTGLGEDYDENFVMASARRFLTCRGKLKKVRGTVSAGTLAVDGRLKVPRKTTFAPQADGMRVALGDRVDEMVSGLVVDGSTATLGEAGAAVSALELTRMKARGARLSLALAVGDEPLPERIELGLDTGAVCFRKTLRCKDKGGERRCR